MRKLTPKEEREGGKKKSSRENTHKSQLVILDLRMGVIWLLSIIQCNQVYRMPMLPIYVQSRKDKETKKRGKSKKIKFFLSFHILNGISYINKASYLLPYLFFHLFYM